MDVDEKGRPAEKTMVAEQAAEQVRREAEIVENMRLAELAERTRLAEKTMVVEQVRLWLQCERPTATLLEAWVRGKWRQG